MSMKSQRQLDDALAHLSGTELFVTAVVAVIILCALGVLQC